MPEILKSESTRPDSGTAETVKPPVPVSQMDNTSPEGGSVCWNCEKGLKQEDICPSCIRVQPFGPERDYFDILDVPNRLMLDPRLLISAYHEKSRTFHPDHHVEDSEKEQTIFLVNSSLVNLAFRILRDPFERAHYFIGRIRGEPAHLHKKASMSPADLMEIMDLKEELEEGVRKGLRQESEQRLREIIDPLERDIFSCFGRIDQILESEGRSGSSMAAALSTLEHLLERRGYLQNLLRDIREGL